MALVTASPLHNLHHIHSLEMPKDPLDSSRAYTNRQHMLSFHTSGNPQTIDSQALRFMGSTLECSEELTL